ncbi:MAG: hypothetical protein HQM13_17965 [SAR324 cluster bacterium]|nr:hypothetical protein [SAR324 cluster bacterium]
MKLNTKNITGLLVLAGLLTFFASMSWAEDFKKKYEEKVKVNNDTIGVIAGVINYVCPKIVDASTKICNEKDPVGSAVGIQKQMGEIEDLDELDESELEEELSSKKILHVPAAMQFYDAVEQFKMHYPLREDASKLAEKGDWEGASLREEMAWQYLVKTASRGIFAKKMVDNQ